MKTIAEYKEKIDELLGYTMAGEKDFADYGNILRIKKFILPHLENKDKGDEFPSELDDFLIGDLILNLSFRYKDRVHLFTIYKRDGKIEY